VGWNVIEASALAFGCFAGSLFSIVIEVIVIFELVITETFGLWADHLALLTLCIAPAKVQPIFTFLRNR
jgi:hypothetical protein